MSKAHKCGYCGILMSSSARVCKKCKAQIAEENRILAAEERLAKRLGYEHWWDWDSNGRPQTSEEAAHNRAQRESIQATLCSGC